MTPLPAQFTEWLKACNEGFARFSGSQFSPHELPQDPPCEGKGAVRQATKLCMDCRKREVKPRQKYCAECAKIRKRESNRRHMRVKRGSDVEKVANSPIRTEALTKPEMQGGYPYPKTSISESSFSTHQASAPQVPEARESLDVAGGIAS
jgi:hypothetical protein